MKKYLAAVALSAALAQPALATTFPSLTTIYVGSGVFDSGDPSNVGSATSIHCSNVSGVTAQVRVLILSAAGAVEGTATNNVVHGATQTVSTHDVFRFIDVPLVTGFVGQGVVNVESTQSGVFCTAMIVDAFIDDVVGVELHLVRVNPHPGTVE